MLSHCVSSSRAIPVWKLLGAAWKEPVYPIYWGANQAGMQAAHEIPWHRQVLARAIWRLASLFSLCAAWLLSKINVHKQIANRVLEPYIHITEIVSGTEWGNLFNLRCHPDAQPEFQSLAYQMLQEYANSVPIPLKDGEWHLPFSKYCGGLTQEEKLKVCTARCARTSYVNFDGSFSKEKDFELHDRLLTSGHFSPFEFCAQACQKSETSCSSSNFVGWKQYRKFLTGENQSSFDFAKLMCRRKF